MSIKRIFLIGLPKTGIHSMSAALRRLGWKRHHVDSAQYYRTGQIDVPEGCFVADEAQRDYWWLHALYPEAGFILMERDVEAWLASLRRHMKRRAPDRELRRLRRVGILGLTEFNAEYHRQLYFRHSNQVRDFFPGADRYLLIHRLGTDGYLRLCRWLRVPVIHEPWPHENASGCK